MIQGTHSAIFSRAVRRRPAWPAALAALALLAGVGPAAAQAPAALDLTPFPVVVFINSVGGTEQVTILFAPAERRETVADLVSRMGQAGGWQAADVRIRDRRYVSWEDLGNNNTKGELQTLVDFAATGIINHQERRIDLQPFIETLGEYGRLRVALRLDEKTLVEGPGDRDDEQVRVRRHVGPRSVVYDIEMKPVLAAPAPVRSGPRGSGWPWAVLGVGAAAALAAAAFALWRKGRRSSAAKAQDAESADAGAGTRKEEDCGG